MTKWANCKKYKNSFLANGEWLTSRVCRFVSWCSSANIWRQNFSDEKTKCRICAMLDWFFVNAFWKIVKMIVPQNRSSCQTLKMTKQLDFTILTPSRRIRRKISRNRLSPVLYPLVAARPLMAPDRFFAISGKSYIWWLVSTYRI